MKLFVLCAFIVMALASAGWCDTVSDEGTQITSISNSSVSTSEQAYFVTNPDATQVGGYHDPSPPETGVVLAALAGFTMFLFVLVLVAV